MSFVWNKIVLFKAKASTIVETLVASVIIVLIFSFASLILNNIFKERITKDISLPENRINELLYLLDKRQIKTPYNETLKNWEISIYEEDLYVVFSAKNNKWIRSIEKKILHEVE